ncbi:MAG: flagellar export chaperone FlgN [Lachnospiraceae bacterium]|uniref:flagellar export chaperone FlgN n=1 Tax=Roseburia hominis TaxID=301301 RepID=UPI001F1E827B|nr:flagellar export chaperone FlgN [Roseburia hominis]MCI5712506.1 flagellar protein FlgN [Lachnospiraceae bacterium]MDD6168820.1 flagellar export chaperone FlgN [Lachnospiraceae bacterium]MEE1250753.1 flagellar export chaperone FlgN [Lachnospiraceae bacterium]
MSGEDYIDILAESLVKKNHILDEIRKLNQEQKQILSDENLTPEMFEKTLDKKAALIDELNQMDEGFQQLYEKVRPEIQEHMEHYADKIRMMQEEIQKITDKTVAIQTEELRNKQLVENKFSSIKKQIREVKSSQKAVNTYYRNMMNRNVMEAQFLDRKK